jgi:hypothetical protein
LVLASMLHDLGKPGATQFSPTESGVTRITSHGHDQAGGPLAKRFLDSIGIKRDITDKVVPLVTEHMQHLNFSDKKPTPRAVRRLAQRLRPATIHELVNVMHADHSGRPPLAGGTPFGAMRLFQEAQNQAVLEGGPTPLIGGRDIMPYFDDVGGPHIGEVQKEAFEAQLNGDFDTNREAQEWLRNRMARPLESFSDDYLRELVERGGPLAERAQRELDKRSRLLAVDRERERNREAAESTYSELFGTDPFWKREEGSEVATLPSDHKRELYARAAFTGEIRNLSGGEPDHFDVYINKVTTRSYIVTVEGGILNPDTGVQVGTFKRSLRGDGSAEHNSLMLEENVRAQGIAQQLNGRAEAFYQAAGLDRIKLFADSTVGGYAWATQGYEWDTEALGLRDVQARLFSGLSSADNRSSLQEKMTDYPALSPAERERAGEYMRQLERAIKDHKVYPETPSPMDLASLGRDTSYTDPAGRPMWFGKFILVGSSWNGVKRLSGGRPAPALPVDLARARHEEEATGHFLYHFKLSPGMGGFPERFDNARDIEHVSEYFEQAVTFGAFQHDVHEHTEFRGQVTRVRDGMVPAAVEFEAAIWRGGQQIGKSSWVAYDDGTAVNQEIELDSGVQGQGIALELSGRVEAFLRAAGYERLKLWADITVGGYAWATQGYGWDDRVPRQFSEDIRRLAAEMAEYISTEAIRSKKRSNGQPWEGVRLSDPEQQRALGYVQAMVRAADAGHILSDTPTPMDLASLGRDTAIDVPVTTALGVQTGTRRMWWGKAMLLGREWHGVKTLGGTSQPEFGSPDAMSDVEPELDPHEDVDPRVRALGPTNRREADSLRWLRSDDMEVPPEQAAPYEAKTKELLRDVDVRIRVPRQVLQEVLQDGRFKNQFESGRSGGTLDYDIRADAEHHLFGYGDEDLDALQDPDMPVNSVVEPAERPIYGYLSNDEVERFAMVQQYGDAITILKPEVRTRTTFTFDDSLAKRYIPSPVNEPSYESLPPLSRLGRPGEEPVFPATPDGTFLSAEHLWQVHGMRYIEAQIHGGVRLEDIERVLFTHGMPSPAIQELLDNLGIEWDLATGIGVDFMVR